MVHPETLQKYPLFGGLMEDQIKTIFPLMHHETFNPDETIIAEGNSNDKIYFLIEGQVIVSKGDVELTRFNEGDAFGEMEVIDVMPSIASIKSLTRVSAISFSNKALREIYKLDIKIFSLIIMNLARELVRRLRIMDEKAASSPSLI
jgi:CRP-like cAMP-binding protein